MTATRTDTAERRPPIADAAMLEWTPLERVHAKTDFATGAMVVTFVVTCAGAGWKFMLNLLK